MAYTYKGLYTAIITPFDKKGSVDFEAFDRLVAFQVESGVSGIVVAGTTGESATLTWAEHKALFEHAVESISGGVEVIASSGSNNTAEALDATSHARSLGIRHALLVDPYYNGPSSLEIRREYLERIATSFPEMGFIPYVIPGRTGTKLMPHDLALAAISHPNIRGVKEATGDLDNMRLTRRLCGPDFSILSGDDELTYTVMTDPAIHASGVISVVSNFAPVALREMCSAILGGNTERAATINRALTPLFECVTIKTAEQTPFGEVTVRARNPLPAKTLMNILGMPAGPLRPPLGKMTKKGVLTLLEKARRVYSANPEVFEPVEHFFDVRVERRLSDPNIEGLYYDGY
ncbi:MAG: 4-hydroxy-tetrahydrodipicolinate synthase [Thermoprotei archaeon]